MVMYAAAWKMFKPKAVFSKSDGSESEVECKNGHCEKPTMGILHYTVLVLAF